VSSPARFRAVRWTFDEETAYEGFTDDSTWNGWLNVWVTPEVHAQVISDLGPNPDDLSDPDCPDSLYSLTPSEGGLYCYGWGYCAYEATP